MKTKILISAIYSVVVPETSKLNTPNSTISYIIGILLALYLLGYLIYSLSKPDEF